MSQKIFFISVLLTGVQLSPISYLLFILVFGGLQVCFWNYVLDNTLGNSTPDGDNDFDDNNDDNNNHNSDDNNINK